MRFWTQYLSQIPIYTPTSQSDYFACNRIVQLVEQMLNLHQRLTEAQTPPAKKMIQQQIQATDRQINQLVYQLYELTDEEIDIVENS